MAQQKMSREARNQYRRKEAEERNAAWRALSRDEQIAVLNGRPGGCSKQFARLYK